MRTRIGVVATTTGVFFFLAGYTVLTRRHPAEDAYILFRYAEHLAAGLGIVFNPTGPRAEGATDFLWLLGLAAGVRMGIDVAVTAVLLNALGSALFTGLLAWAVTEASWPSARIWQVLAIILSGAFLSSHIATAAYLGFSSSLYAALVVLLLWTALRYTPRSTLWIPWVGLVIALFRPDGVIIGVGFTLTGIAQARQLGIIRRYMAGSVATAIVGLSYFAWRYAYFGLLLPLPLYVKARAATLYNEGVGAVDGSMLTLVSTYIPGLQYQLDYLVQRTSPLPMLMAILCLTVAIWKTRSVELRRISLHSLPLVAFFCLLTFGQLLQNAAFRFQAPISAAVLFVFVRVAAWAFGAVRGGSSRVVLAVALVPVVALPLAPGIQSLREFVDADPTVHDYMDSFAPIAGATLGEQDVVVLLDADRRVPLYEGLD